MSEKSMYVYGFISDELFWKKQTVDLDKSIDVGLGYLDDILVNYFHQIGTIYDPRDARIDVIGEVPTGKIYLQFDVSKIDTVNDTIFTDPDMEELKCLFNIIEKCYMTQNRMENELNDELMDDEVTFKGYVEDSVRRPTSYSLVNPDSIRTELKIYDYVEFRMLFGGIDVRFRLWINSEKFKVDYPLTTITTVVPPCEPKYLLDPTTQKSPITSIIEASNSIFDNTNSGTTNVDHTGMMAFKTKWVISSQNTQEVKFGLMYQGAVPSSLEAREAIRDYLIGLGIAPEATWEDRFPDLFITAQFFLIPHWGNITERPNNKYGSVYPAIINYNLLKDNTLEFLPSFEPDWINENLEVLINPFNTILLTCVPDPLNEDNKFSLLKWLDTYQAFAPDDTNYDYQEANAKEFSRYLGTAMAILYGENASMNGFTENEFYKKRYLSFSSEKVEYHVLFREDYII